MLKKYTHLFFDLDNTIWDFDANSYDALHEALKKKGLLDKIGAYDDYYKIFASVSERLWSLYREGKLAKAVLRVQRFEESFEKNGTPFPGMEESVSEAYLAEIPGLTRLVEGARGVLDYLHGKYEMAIITNGSREMQNRKIIQSGLLKYFRKIFVSEEIGAPKPKKAIFDHAVKSMNARKRNSLMIGDSWEADILGAMQCGIDQIYYSPGHNDDVQKIMADGILISNQIKTNKTSTVIISSLTELLEIL
jgi:YjjG family noncanonical pyrimidine nucleotidase